MPQSVLQSVPLSRSQQLATESLCSARARLGSLHDLAIKTAKDSVTVFPTEPAIELAPCITGPASDPTKDIPTGRTTEPVTDLTIEPCWSQAFEPSSA